MPSKSKEEVPRERAVASQGSGGEDAAKLKGVETTEVESKDINMEVTMEKEDIEESMRDLLEEAAQVTGSLLVERVSNRLHVIKEYVDSKEIHLELLERVMKSLADVVDWETPNDANASEIINIALIVTARHNHKKVTRWAVKILSALLEVPRHISGCSGFNEVFEVFNKVVEEGYRQKEENVRHMCAISEVLGILARHRTHQKPFVNLLPKIKAYFELQDIENHQFNHEVIKVACQALRMYSPIFEMDQKDLESISNSIFEAISKLLPDTETYSQRASLISCITMIAESRLNLPLLRHITEGDLLIRLNEGWQHEAMVGICMVSVFIECLNHLSDDDFIAVADNCLRLYDVYSSTDDYQTRERLITLLYVFSNRMKMVYDSLKEKELQFFQKAAECLLFKATHEIQALNVPKRIWADEGFVTFVRTTLPSLINITSKCVITLSICEQGEKVRPPTPTSVHTEVSGIHEDSANGEQSRTVVMMDTEKLPITVTEDDEEAQLPDSKRPLTQIECIEIYKSMCCLYEAASTANSLLSDIRANGLVNDAFLQPSEIKSLIRMSLKMFVGIFRSTALKQWIKLMIPVVFVMSLKDKFLLSVFECLRKGYAEIFAPHMLTFILLLLKNKENTLEYLKNVVSYSEGMLGLFSLSEWEPCARRLEGQTVDSALDLAQAAANCMFAAFAEYPETLAACQNEIMYLTTAVSKLPVTSPDRLITVATGMFRGINKVKDYSLTMLMLRMPIEVIVRKIIRAGTVLHRDWLELMMVTAARGPFTPEIVTLCAKPALCILRDFKWELVTTALEMLESWSDCLPPDEFYNLLSQVLVYEQSQVTPQFVECLYKYLQNERLPHYKRNAGIIMNIFSKIGLCAKTCFRELDVKPDIPYTIAVTMDRRNELPDTSENSESIEVQRASMKWICPVRSVPYGNGAHYEHCSSRDGNEDINDNMSDITIVGVRAEKKEVPTHTEPEIAIPVGIPVVEGLNCVIRQMVRRDISEVAFEGCAGFVISAVSPLMNFDSSLSEAWLNVACKQPNRGRIANDVVKYHVQEDNQEFLTILMHALVKTCAIGRRRWKDKGIFKDMEMLISALSRYLVIATKAHTTQAISVSVEPVMVLSAVADRLLVTQDEEEYNFDLPLDHVDSMEGEVATDILLEVFNEANKMHCVQLCNSIVTMLCLKCNSHKLSRKMGSCVALGRLCKEYPEILKPAVLDVANAISQLYDGNKRAYRVMKEALEALLKVDEPVVIQWAASLLEHPLWYLRASGQICISAVSDRKAILPSLQNIYGVVRNIQAPDVQVFLATFEGGDLSLIDLAINGMQPYMQSIAENGDIDEMFRAQGELYLDLLGRLLTSEEYAKAAEEMEDTFNHVLVYFIKLIIVGGPEIVEKAKRTLKDSKNVSVSSKTLSMALEEYIFQLQTIFDETLLDRILEVVKAYRSFVDEALTESLFNVAKALVEGTLNSSVNDEYKNAHFIDYMIFLSDMGARRACADVIFGQWFKSIDRIKKGVIIPGSVAYGIWQVLSYNGVICNVFGNNMQMEYIGLLYFGSLKADMDYILWNTVSAFGSGNHTAGLLYVTLVSWLCSDNMKLVSESKHFNKLLDVVIKVAASTTMHVDDLITAPSENVQVVNWKLAYSCATVLFNMAPVGTLLDKIMKHKKQDYSSKFDKVLAKEFMQQYPIRRNEGMLNPIVGGHIFDMRNYQLRHILRMLNEDASKEIAKVKEDIISFCWSSLEEGDAMAKLLSLCCMAKIVDMFNSPPVAAAVVFKELLDVLVSEDIYTFLTMHYTVKLDMSSKDKQTSTLYQQLKESTSMLIKNLSCVAVPSEMLKSMKDSIPQSNKRHSIWYALLLAKIKELSDNPRCLVTLLSVCSLHIQDDVSMILPVLLDVIKVIGTDILPIKCNLVQGGVVDALFGTVAVADRYGLDIDAYWLMKSCITAILSAIVSNSLDHNDITPYLPLVVKLFVRAPHFDVFGKVVKKLTTDRVFCYRFNQSHLLHDRTNNGNHEYLLMTKGCRRRSNIQSKEQIFENERKKYQRVGTVILEIISRTLDQISLNADQVGYIIQELGMLWYMKGECCNVLLQSCIFKLCSHMSEEFANTDRSLLASDCSVTLKEFLRNGEGKDKDARVKMEDLKSEFEEVQSPAEDLHKQVDVTEAYLDKFPRWLLGLILGTFKAAKNDPPNVMRLVDEGETLNLVCHYLETATMHYVEAPTASSSDKSTPSSSLSMLSRMSSAVTIDNKQERLYVPEQERGRSFSTAVRSTLTLLAALSGDWDTMVQVLKDITPSFLAAIEYALLNVTDVELFSKGLIRVYTNVYAIPAVSSNSYEFIKEYDNDGSIKLCQMIHLLVWLLPEFEDDVKNRIVEVIRKFTLESRHPYNEVLLKIATDITGSYPYDSVDVDMLDIGKWQTEARLTYKRGERAKRKSNKGSENVPMDEEDMEDVATESDDSGTKVQTLSFISIVGDMRDNIKWVELKTFMKGKSKTFPKQLLESGEPMKGELKSTDVVPPMKKSKLPMEFEGLLKVVKSVMMKQEHRVELRLEVVYALRHLSCHSILGETYYQLMLNCLEQSGKDSLIFKEKLIAYLSCVSRDEYSFIDAYEELGIPSGLFSLVKYLLSSNISFNRDSAFYIPLYLDVLFTSALADCDVSVTEHYPSLPALVPNKTNFSMHQIDLICQEEVAQHFKPSVILLKQFRRMQLGPHSNGQTDAPNGPLAFEIVNEEIENISEALRQMHKYNKIYFQRIVKVSYFKEFIRKMWHTDEEFASNIWTSVFPQLYTTFTSFQQKEVGKTLCCYLGREEHLCNKSDMCQTILRGAIKCHPPIHIPPEILKYLAVYFGVWDEVLHHLEKQLLSQPLEITRMATVLSDIYDRLNMSDMAIGAYRTWVITQETRLALCFLQHAKWKQSQREFNSIMESLALTGQTAEAVSSFDESKIWYNGWVNATKQLGEWDLLRDVAFVAGDKPLFLQASTALHDWAEVLPEDGIHDVNMTFALEDADCTINRVYQKLHTALLPFKDPDNNITANLIIKCGRKAESLLSRGRSKVLESWRHLPKGLSDAHVIPMQLHQKLLEIDEGLNYLVDIMRSVDKGDIPEVPPILNKWRKRMPSPRDLPAVWNSMLSWRSFLFSSVRNMLLNSHNVPNDSKLQACLNLQDLQWTLTKFASITRKSHQLPLVASVILNKVQKFHRSILEQSNLVSEDCFVIMIERIKQYLTIPVNVHEALKGAISVDLNTLPSSGCETLKSHTFRLMADAINRKSAFELPKRPSSADNEMASKYLLEALKLEPMMAKNWISWAKYNDKCIDHIGMTQGKTNESNYPADHYEAAITGYLVAVSIRPHSHWLLLGRVVTLLNEVRGVVKSGICSEAFKTYSDMVPISVWLLWLPQLISAVNHKENHEFQHILQLLMFRLPQQVFYPLRCEYFAQNATVDGDNGLESSTVSTMKRLLSTLISSNPSVGTMLESFAATITHMGRPDFVDEIVSAAETIFEECLDLPFNERVPPQMFNGLSLKMSHRSSMTSDGGECDAYISQMMKDLDVSTGSLSCGETMNLLLNWISRLKELSKSSHSSHLQQQMQYVKLHHFCQRLQMLNMELQLPTLQSTSSLLKPKQRYCLGECMGVVSLLPEVKKRKRGIHTVKSISILAQNGQIYVYTVQPLPLTRQKSDQHVSQMLKLLNHYALKFNETRRRDILLPVTLVVSLDPYLCLYQEDSQDETMSTIFSKSISFKNLVKEMPDIKSYIHAHPAMYNETNLLLLVLHKMLMEIGVTQQLLQRWKKFNPDCVEDLTFTRVYQLFKEKQYPWFTTWYKKTHQEVLMDAYSQVCALIPDDLLVKHAMKRFKTYQDFMEMKRRITSHYAIQALLGLMFVTSYATPCKLSMNFTNGIVKHLDFRLNYSRDIFVEYSKLRVFRFTRNLKTMIGPVCRMGVMPAVIYSMCSAIHTYKIDILGTLSAVLADDFATIQITIGTPRDKPEPAIPPQLANQQQGQRSNSGSHPSTPIMMPKREFNPLDEYIGRVLNYCSYLRSPTDQEQCNMPINNIICCIIDASADSGTLGKLKTSYQPWF